MIPDDLNQAITNLEELLALLKAREQRELEEQKKAEEQKKLDEQKEAEEQKKEVEKQKQIEQQEAEEKKLETEEKKKIEKEKESFNDLMKNIDENISKLADENAKNNLDMLNANAEVVEEIKVLTEKESEPPKPTTAEHVINIYGLVIVPGILIIILLWRMIKPFT